MAEAAGWGVAIEAAQNVGVVCAFMSVAISCGATYQAAVEYNESLLGMVEAAQADQSAAALGAAPSTGGESAAAARGREMHEKFDYGPGFNREVRTPDGRYRVDAVDFPSRTILELKPDNPRAVAAGARQLSRYLDYFDQAYPGETPWSGQVVTYQ